MLTRKICNGTPPVGTWIITHFKESRRIWQKRPAHGEIRTQTSRLQRPSNRKSKPIKTEISAALQGLSFSGTWSNSKHSFKVDPANHSISQRSLNSCRGGMSPLFSSPSEPELVKIALEPASSPSFSLIKTWIFYLSKIKLPSFESSAYGSLKFGPGLWDRA